MSFLAISSLAGRTGLFQKKTRLEKQKSGQLSPQSIQTRMDKWLLGTVAENSEGFMHPDFILAKARQGNPPWGSGLSSRSSASVSRVSGQATAQPLSVLGIAWYWIAAVASVVVGGLYFLLKGKKRRR